MRTAHLLTSALLYTSFTAAFQWRDAWSDGKAMAMDALVKRQTETLGNTDAGTPNPTDSITTSQQSSTSSSDDSSATTSDSSSDRGSTSTARSGSRTTTARSTDGSSSTRKSNSRSSTTSSSISINPAAAAGGITMLDPNTVSSTTYYKISDLVTFAWNYTSLSVTPSYVDVLASCSLNQATYTIALNQTVAGATGNVTWDTNQYATVNTQQQLVVGTYTLIIHDAAQDVSATASAGYLGTQDDFTFAMYTKQAYTPLDDFVCVTCSGAMTAMEKQTIMFLLGMATITVLSFTAFAGNAGVF